jgi:hypothetical protein
VVHELAEVVLGAEDVAELGRGLEGFPVLPEPEPRLDFAGRAAGGRDQALGIGVQQLAVQPGPLAEDRVQGGDRGGAEQVPHADVVVAQQRHVRVGATAGDVILALVLFAPAHAGLVCARGSRRDIGLDADDRLDALVGGPLPEVERPEEVAMVRGGQGGHAQPLGLIEEFPEARRAVQHGVLGVVVEVDERVVAGSHRIILVPGSDTHVPGAAVRADLR